ELSFAQFQADKAVVGLARQLRKAEDALDGYAEAATCDRGAFMEYARLRQQVSELEKGAAKARRADRREEAVTSLEQLRPGDVIERLRRELRDHPCHACPDREEHARWAERWFKLEKDARTLRRRVEERTNTVARQFDRVCEVLTAVDYLDGDTVTERGQRLMR